MTVDTSAEEPRRSRFYDVQRVLEHFDKTKVRPSLGLLSRFTRAVWGRLDAFQGLIIILAGGGLIIFSMSLVTVGLLYGPLALLGSVGGLFFALSFFIEKKVGRSIVFGQYSVWKRAAAQGIAFVVFAGIIFLLLLINGLA